MSNAGARPIMIVAGGTGGHMFPGVALAQILAARGHRVVFVSDTRGASVSRESLGLPEDIERYEVAAGRIGGSAAAIVGDPNDQLVVAIGEAHSRPRRTGVFERVGERLLDDAIGGQFEAGGQWAGLAFDHDLDGQPGMLALVDQPPEVVEARGGRKLGLVVVAAQNPEDATHLPE